MHVAARGGVAAQDDPDAAFAVEVAAQPVVHDSGRGQARDPRGEPGPGQLPHHPATDLHVLQGNGPGADRAVGVGGGHQPDGKIGGQCLVRQVVKCTAVDLTARQREDHGQRLLDLGGHHITRRTRPCHPRPGWVRRRRRRPGRCVGCPADALATSDIATVRMGVSAAVVDRVPDDGGGIVIRESDEGPVASCQ